ncbi:beta-ketoacyl-ACP synthase II [Alkalilimnicola ehrlichii MLHE-1]|uniref:3-oxoacyl-[acyl-carrier-protein] synthase 2 n=1 Tax=Alkalilimnicola ehrlichii (strain ATCC BAA-1101 / DSM 17681 / MLHE-1) TaxID=187272 RepID=Q0A8R9_ALKEH|nr:beta-ketoacyl-ACP synthase II [Alkalilimnicola ehrlichii]ABI56768.1 3-oxoacyl-[acyl-carrier-protein] synthase II [Alkalilimnicola ehrlichii MLHE-1]
MSKRRVAVTGLGLVCPQGNTVDEAWENILAGRSAARSIDRFDASEFPVQFAAMLQGFDVGRYLSPKEARKMDPFIHYAIAAGVQAMEDSGLAVSDENADRIGVSIGSGIGGISGIEANMAVLNRSGARRISPFFVPSSIINMASGHLSIRYGLKGPNLATVTACAAGTHNIGQAARAIAYGDVDAMLAGGSEMPISPLGLAGFAAARALSNRNDEPAQASRPFEKGRDGFVLGEGAGIVVLEEMEAAKRRGATIYGELAGFGMSGDAYHITLPAEGGDGARRCMVHALRDAHITPDQVDYINAHGTSTPAGDRVEVEAVRTAFGDHADRLAMSSTKSMTGHLLGAAGGVEAIFSLLALRDQVAPPTINYEEPDPDCRLDFVPNEARDLTMNVALSNSFGFGGTNGSLVFRRV